MALRGLKILTVSLGILTTIATAGYAVEINNSMAPIGRANVAPLPNSHYDTPKSIKNYRPEQTVPGGPTFNLNKGPDINHQQWCNYHYKSYRSSDNSYIDHGGVRQSCNSPFHQ